MKTIIKYRAPLFCGHLPSKVLRSMQHDDCKSSGLEWDVYGRTYILSGPPAAEASRALVKAFGGSFETIV